MREKYGRDFYPESPVRFIDAFFGSGSVSMWITERYPEIEIIANDYNEDIINIYQQIKINLVDFVSVVEEFDVNYIAMSYDQRKLFYYEERNRHGYESLSDIERAGLLFSLLKTSFNGIWQNNQNTNNRFGTPFGLGNETDSIYDKSLVNKFHKFAQNITFLHGDFEQVKQFVIKDSYLYLDPPYRDTDTKYTNDGFDDDDQIRMIHLMNYADREHGMVAMSNKYHGDKFFESKLNDGFETLVYDVKYTAGRGANKQEVKEGLWKNFENEKTPLELLL